MDPTNKILLVIALVISSSETVLKWSKLGRSEGAGMLKESVLENESLILVILSENKVTKWLARHSLDS